MHILYVYMRINSLGVFKTKQKELHADAAYLLLV